MDAEEEKNALEFRWVDSLFPNFYHIQ